LLGRRKLERKDKLVITCRGSAVRRGKGERGAEGKGRGGERHGNIHEVSIVTSNSKKLLPSLESTITGFEVYSSWLSNWNSRKLNFFGVSAKNHFEERGKERREGEKRRGGRGEGEGKREWEEGEKRGGYLE
jgi:hypothetical protein